MEPGLVSILNGSVSGDEAGDIARRALEEPSPDPRWHLWHTHFWEKGFIQMLYSV